jgi:hypothetical protein
MLAGRSPPAFRAGARLLGQERGWPTSKGVRTIRTHRPPWAGVHRQEAPLRTILLALVAMSLLVAPGPVVGPAVGTAAAATPPGLPDLRLPEPPTDDPADPPVDPNDLRVPEQVESCRLMLEGEPLPVGLSTCPGVRPGALVLTDLGGSGCTLNYLFIAVHPVTGHQRRMIGTAGHCILLSNGERTWAAGTGPVARNSANQAIGRFVYATLATLRDFALIELFDGVPASAQMCHFGGPVGVDTSTRAGPVGLEWYGQGMGFQSTVPARSGVARDLSRNDEVFFDGATSFGDSGAAVHTSEGKALGIAVAITAAPQGIARAVRLRPQVDDASRALGLALHLQTAPRLEPSGSGTNGGGLLERWLERDRAEEPPGEQGEPGSGGGALAAGLLRR